MDSADFAASFTLSLPPGWQEQLPNAPLESDEARMSFVVRLGLWNIENSHGGPFSAAVFDRDSGQLISIGVNRVVPQNCSMAHAEALAIGLAQQRLQTFDLTTVKDRRFELYASGQPCVQCFGMTWWSGVSRLVVGARAADIERLTGFQEGPLVPEWKQIFANRSPQPPIDVQMDVCRTEACQLLSRYTEIEGPNYSPGLS